MRCRQNHLCVKAHARADLGREAAEDSARLPHGLEDRARQAEAGDKLVVPRTRHRAYKRRRRGVSVLVCGNAREEVVEVVRHHKEGAGALELLRALAHLRHKLIGGVEPLELDARARIVLVKGDDTRALEVLVNALGAPVAIRNRVPNARAVLVQKHIVNGPGVDTDCVGCKPLLARRG